MAKLKLIQQAFRNPLRRGYRYYRPRWRGNAHSRRNVFLLKPVEPGMQEEITPAAARLKCPEMDLRVIFHSSSRCRTTPATEDFLLSDLAPMIYAVLASRFDIRIIVPDGLPSFFFKPNGLD